MLALKIFLFTILAPGTVTVLIPYFIRSSNIEIYAINLGYFSYIGFALLFIGGSIYFVCATDFAIEGKGTPAPSDPPKKLVIKRLYRFVRNPMYVGIITILTGEAVLFSSVTLLLYAGVVFIGFNSFILFYEEPKLTKLFGEEYSDYCKKANRWIPKF